MQKRPITGAMSSMFGGMPRMMGVPCGRALGPSSDSPFIGANVRVKASAPNTIQYLTARLIAPRESLPGRGGTNQMCYYSDYREGGPDDLLSGMGRPNGS